MFLLLLLPFFLSFPPGICFQSQDPLALEFMYPKASALGFITHGEEGL